MLKSKSENNNEGLHIRLTAVWALSESALGGVLHALRVPFTGLVVGGVAMAIIVLMARLGGKRSELFGATMVVLVIKAIVSPHSPPTAYLAIAFQSSLGFLLFPLLRKSDFTLLLFALMAVVESGLQKLLVLTLLFGENLWQSIDVLGRLLARQFHLTALAADGMSISRLIIVVYLGIHLISAFVMAVWLRSFSRYVTARMGGDPSALAPMVQVNVQNGQWTKSKKRFRLSYLIYPLALVLVFLSYFMPELEQGIGGRALVMIVRSLAILKIWYKFIAIHVRRAILKFIHHKKTGYRQQINATLEILPFLKDIVYGQWQKYRGDKRISFKGFVEETLLFLLLAPRGKN